MDLCDHEGDQNTSNHPTVRTSSYVGGHVIGQHNQTHSHVAQPISTLNPDDDDDDEEEEEEEEEGAEGEEEVVVVRYRECLKNHAASIGGTALDGCGEFMPGGAEGTTEALQCSACSCHRNFHRKHVMGHSPFGPNRFFILPGSRSRRRSRRRRGSPAAHHHHHHHMVMPLGAMHAADCNEEEEEEDVMVEMEMEVERRRRSSPAAAAVMRKKRFRTKFSQEQKEKMTGFAERVGWRMQRVDDGAVQQFCQEVGVKRRTLKVWMHNNKHSLAKKAAAASSSSLRLQS